MAKPVNGMVGIWLDDRDVIKAARATREAGFKKFEAITPFPMHEMEEACGVKRSFIPWVTFVAGVVGALAGLGLTYWTSVVSWPVIIAGKPFFSLPAFIPVIFELTILFAALSSVGAMIIANRLPAVDPPIIDPDLSSHKFAVFIPENDVGYDEERIQKMFKELHASEVRRAVF